MKTSTNPTQQARTRATMAMILISALVFATSAAMAGPKTVTIVPPNATYHGKSYAEWSAAAAKFGMEHPLEGHPALDTTDFDVRSGQKGAVWFLGGPFGTHERSITIPHGKALFFILLNVDASSIEEPPFHGDTDAEQRAIATFFGDHIVNAFFTVDGEAVQNIGDFRVSSPQFEFTAPTPWLFGATGGTGTAVVDGYYVMLARLPKGEHTIHYGGAFHFAAGELGSDPVDLPVDITYHVTVK